MTERKRERGADEGNESKLKRESETERLTRRDNTKGQAVCLYTGMYSGKTNQDGVNR